MNMQQISLDVLAEKYAKGDETTIDEVLLRAAKALAQCEEDRQAAEQVGRVGSSGRSGPGFCLLGASPS